MANEITFNVSLRVEKDNLLLEMNPAQQRIDMSEARGGSPGYIVVSETPENLDFSDLTTLGLLRIKNLDSDAFIEVGVDSGGFIPICRWKPGEDFVFRMVPGTTYQIRAQPQTGTGTANADALVWGFND